MRILLLLFVILVHCVVGIRAFSILVENRHAATFDDYQSKTSLTQLEATRRDFMETTVSTVLGSSIVGTSVASSAAQAVESSSLSASSSIALPPMGLGAWAWGDSLFWGYDKKNDDELKRVFDYAVRRTSPLLLDTAEIYGLGRSETLIGDFAKSYPESNIQIATKFAALPWCTQAKDVVKACQKSLSRLGRDSIDLYQIHFPNAWSNEAYWDGLAQCYEQGLVKAVGVSNYGVDAVRACHKALQARDIPLSTNQIQLSLLYQWPLSNGLLQACDDLGVQVLSYSPLALGMLTGKYTTNSKPSGPRKKLYEDLVTTPDYEQLLSVMNDVASGHPNANLPQVALNWARAKGTVPIPGARTLAQAQSNFAALDWSLSKEEVQILDRAAAKVTTFIKPEANPFPRKDKDTGLVMYDS